MASTTCDSRNPMNAVCHRRAFPSHGRMPLFPRAIARHSYPLTMRARQIVCRRRWRQRNSQERRGRRIKQPRTFPRRLRNYRVTATANRGMGHKSLHSCFGDDHAAHCATCTDEALLAYRLQKEQHLSAKQIRERIIAEFSDR